MIYFGKVFQFFYLIVQKMFKKNIRTKFEQNSNKIRTIHFNEKGRIKKFSKIIFIMLKKIVKIKVYTIK